MNLWSYPNISNDTKMTIKKCGLTLIGLSLMLGGLAACSEPSVEETSQSSAEETSQPAVAVEAGEVSESKPSKSDSNSKPTADISSDISSGTSSSPELIGTYAVSGANLDKSVYDGTLTISAGSGDSYQLSWQTGNNFEGIGIVQNNTLAAAWGGESCSIVTYRQSPDGGLAGEWVLPGQSGVGTETAVATGASAKADIVGAYAVTGTNPDGSAYEGTLTVSAEEDVYQFAWDVGNSYKGVGIQQGNLIAVGWGSDNCGVVAYAVKDNASLQGTWGVYGQSQLGTEEAVKE